MAWETSLRLIRVGVRNVILLSFFGICCYSGSADSFDCPKPIAWRHIDSKSALGSIATANAEHAYECGTQENVLPSRIYSSPVLIDPCEEQFD